MMYQKAAGDSGVTLEDYLTAIRSRLWMLPLGVAIMVGLGWLYQSQSAVTYTAEARVALGPMPVNGSRLDNPVNPVLEKETELLASLEVANAVVDLLDLDQEGRDLLLGVETSFVPSSEVIRVSYTDGDAERAASIANGFASVYADQREAASLSLFETQLALAGQSLADTQAALDDFEAQQSELLERRASALALPTADPARDTEITAVDTELANGRALQNQLVVEQRTNQASVRTAEQLLATRPTAAQLLGTASVPTTPDGLSSTWIYIGTALLGLGLGVAATFVAERLDTTARDREDVALALGARVLGSIPMFNFNARTGAAALIMTSDSKKSWANEAREAFRALRGSFHFAATAGGNSVLLVTSAYPAEGKSVVSANLAVALAQGGYRCALVSADMRRSSLEELFGGLGTDHLGLSGFLAGDDQVELIQPPGIDNLWFLPSGATPANPGELLGSPRFGMLINELRGGVDYVIVDTPPVLSTADTSSASSSADAVLVVIDSRRTDTDELLHARAELELAGAKMVGAVLNKVKRPRRRLGSRNRYAYTAAN